MAEKRQQQETQESPAAREHCHVDNEKKAVSSREMCECSIPYDVMYLHGTHHSRKQG